MHLLFLSYAQNDTDKRELMTLPLLEIKDSVIYQLLDTIEYYNNNCMYAKHVPYYFEICPWSKRYGDTLKISVLSKQYDCFFMRCDKDSYGGYFYYKENLVLVRGLDTFYFRKTDTQRDIYCESDGNYFDYQTNLLDEIGITYYYFGGKLNCICKCLCQPESPFYIRIIPGRTPTTWEGIMKKYNVTEEDLIKLNQDNNLNLRMKITIDDIIKQKYDFTEEELIKVNQDKNLNFDKDPIKGDIIRIY